MRPPTCDVCTSPHCVCTLVQACACVGLTVVFVVFVVFVVQLEKELMHSEEKLKAEKQALQKQVCSIEGQLSGCNLPGISICSACALQPPRTQ